MNIKRRIWSLPVISSIIFGIGVAISASISMDALDSISSTEVVDYPALDAAKVLPVEIKVVMDGLRDAVSEGDKDRLALVDHDAGKVRSHLAKLAQVPGMEANSVNLTKLFDNYYAPALSSAKIMLEIDQGDAQDTVKTMRAALGDLNKGVAEFGEVAQKQFKDGLAKSAADVRRVLVVTITTAAIVLLALAIIAFIVVRAIWRELGGEPEYARSIARAVAGGDLAATIQVDPKAPDSLLAALKTMRERLSGIVTEVKQSADTIALASAEIASGNADLSVRTESQAAQLENTTRAMVKLTEAVRMSADNAGQANDLVVSASSVAVRGGQVVGNVVNTMGDINASAKQIVEIIAVIDGIAFQTNILALNAAVEAARAGEQGRGFAVVAGEVRTLAQRSAEAAKQIKALIGDSVAKIDTGARLVNEAGETMEQIVLSVRKVHDIMTEISGASQTQRSEIEQIGRAVDDVDGMTQQNAALVEQASAAAESLREQAAHLASSLGFFKVAGADEAKGEKASAPAISSAGGSGSGLRLTTSPAKSQQA